MSTFTPDEFAVMHINDLERHKFVLTSDGKIAIRILGGSGGDMLKSENLAGLTDYAIARSNLEVYSSDEIDTLLTGYALTGHNHDGVYSPVGHTHAGVYEPVFSKNTGFNKNFGTAAGTVLEGNRDALYEKLANKGQANGYAPLDSGSLIPSMYLPSYVDDVIDVALYANLPGTGESGKIYNVYGDTISLNGSYRWGGSAYSKISSVSDAVWGHITGTLTDQADLVSAFAGKADLSHTHVLADLPAISQNHFLGRNSSGSGTIEVLSATQARSALSVYSQAEITSYLSSKANDSEVVHLTGDETIAGNKTFTNAGTTNIANTYRVTNIGVNQLIEIQNDGGLKRMGIIYDNSIPGIGIQNRSGGNLLRILEGNGYMGLNTATPICHLDIRSSGGTVPAEMRVAEGSGFARSLRFISPSDLGSARIKVDNTVNGLNIGTRDYEDAIAINGSTGHVSILGDNYSSSWITFTPTFTATAGTATMSDFGGNYKKMGKLIFFTVTFRIASIGTASGALEINTPLGSSWSTASFNVSGFIAPFATNPVVTSKGIPYVFGNKIYAVKSVRSATVQWSDVAVGDYFEATGYYFIA